MNHLHVKVSPPRPDCSVLEGPERGCVQGHTAAPAVPKVTGDPESRLREGGR